MKKHIIIQPLLFTLILFSFSQCGKDSEVNNEEIVPTTTIVNTFNKAHLSFGDGRVQSKEGTFNFPVNSEKITQILMYVKLECPNGGCGAWDVFANIKVKDASTNNWFEMGRYITPYGVDNSQRGEGFVFDVTDFKSLLQGNVQLKSFVEVWTIEGWLLTVDFKITEGEPTYKYSAIVPLIDHTNNSQQIPYGEEIPNTIKLSGNISIPENAKAARLRSVISGWGHATPLDNDGRPSAEWGFRTHLLKIGTQEFHHVMGGIGCSSNPVKPQNGNWEPDRAGWCPGQEVPIRVNSIQLSNIEESLKYQYSFEDWTNDKENGNAYYSLSSYLIVESDTPIQKPVVN
ncbi:peptide-N-glycosidase F-related protein [Lutibacter aestuarii]|uniref:Peptide-N-glycosidase F-related protein n=1 Tax=Lutibacter aestuarii TaxID=861111 RepID=A0ABW2Z742_9FLAO